MCFCDGTKRMSWGNNGWVGETTNEN